MARCFFLVQNPSDLRYGKHSDMSSAECIASIRGCFTPELDDSLVRAVTW